jgi:hypothetical protein
MSARESQVEKDTVVQVKADSEPDVLDDRKGAHKHSYPRNFASRLSTVAHSPAQNQQFPQHRQWFSQQIAMISIS